MTKRAAVLSSCCCATSGQDGSAKQPQRKWASALASRQATIAKPAAGEDRHRDDGSERGPALRCGSAPRLAPCLPPPLTGGRDNVVVGARLEGRSGAVDQRHGAASIERWPAPVNAIAKSDAGSGPGRRASSGRSRATPPRPIVEPRFHTCRRRATPLRATLGADRRRRDQAAAHRAWERPFRDLTERIPVVSSGATSSGWQKAEIAATGRATRRPLPPTAACGAGPGRPRQDSNLRPAD